jgi:FKBP-type peptidyl-prolyl cis-trans isomerase
VRLALDPFALFSCFGQDGKVFDGRTMDKKVPALQFKVGVGKVIKAWDHALLEMSVGEVAKLTVEPEWGYGALLSDITCS